MSVLIKKKILFKNTSGFFILLLVVYVYFIGAIAAYGLKRENHRALLKTEHKNRKRFYGGKLRKESGISDGIGI